MQTKIEGLILSKIPYDERHIIAHLLLRSGRKISVVFYGGRGGGKKQKSSVLELGFMVSVELAQAKTNSDIYHAKEWNLIWHHDLIRSNHTAFYLACFYLEIINKISPTENLHEVHDENTEMVGLFASLSNALVHLERSLKENSFYSHSHSVIFLTKTLLHLGVFPEREQCTLCGVELQGFNDMYLLAEEGGFACPPCMNQRKSYSVQSGWYPDTKLRLIKKTEARWGGENPHDILLMKNNQESGFLKGDLLHYSYESIAAHVLQTDKFTTIAARTAFKQGKRSSLFKIFTRPALKFMRDYFFKRGFLDGRYGFIICCINSLYALLKYAKLHELQNGKKI